MVDKVSAASVHTKAAVGTRWKEEIGSFPFQIELALAESSALPHIFGGEVKTGL